MFWLSLITRIVYFDATLKLIELKKIRRLVDQRLTERFSQHTRKPALCHTWKHRLKRERLAAVYFEHELNENVNRD